MRGATRSPHFNLAMAIIVVASVHHTGTKFVYRYLLDDANGWNFVVPNPDTSQAGDHEAFLGKVRIHIDEPLMPRAINWMKEFPTLVPLRHPRNVAISWKAREKSLDWLEKQWELLKTVVDTFEPCYLPLNDSPLKDEFLYAASTKLGVKFPHAWPIVCSENLMAELTDEEEQRVQRWMADGFFERFGYV